MPWGVKLRGEPIDIGDWQHVLKPPFEPWVEVHGSDTILRSASFDTLTSAEDVLVHATELISSLNGTLAVWDRTRPISLDCVAEFSSDGGVKYHVFAAAHIEGRSKMRADIQVCGPDGNPLPPQPSEVQKWVAVADTEERLKDALVFFGRGQDWFDIYKCIECIEGFYGGEHKLLKLRHENASEIKRMKSTANSFRHANYKNSLSNPMSRKEACNLLACLLRRALEDSQQNSLSQSK